MAAACGSRLRTSSVRWRCRRAAGGPADRGGRGTDTDPGRRKRSTRPPGSIRSTDGGAGRQRPGAHRRSRQRWRRRLRTAGRPRSLHARGATSTGVTPTEIKVGNVSQITGLVPGFGQTGVNGVRAYFNMVNASWRRVRPEAHPGDRRRSLPVGHQPGRDREAGRPGGRLRGQHDGGRRRWRAGDRGARASPTCRWPPRRPARRPRTTSRPTRSIRPRAGNGSVKILTYFKQTFGVESSGDLLPGRRHRVNQSRNYEIDFEKAGIPVVGHLPVAPRPPTSAPRPPT
jgi:hypothetical protein